MTQVSKTANSKTTHGIVLKFELDLLYFIVLNKTTVQFKKKILRSVLKLSSGNHWETDGRTDATYTSN